MACMFLISCNKNEENNPISEKLLRDSIIKIYKSRGNVQNIAPDLILLTEIESNGDQPVEQRGAYQCAVTLNNIIQIETKKNYNDPDIKTIKKIESQIYKLLDDEINKHKTEKKN
jgi:hypothetical protein